MKLLSVFYPPQIYRRKSVSADCIFYFKKLLINDNETLMNITSFEI